MLLGFSNNQKRIVGGIEGRKIGRAEFVDNCLVLRFENGTSLAVTFEREEDLAFGTNAAVKGFVDNGAEPA